MGASFARRARLVQCFAAVAECIRATLRPSWATGPCGFESLRRYLQGSSADEQRPHKPRNAGSNPVPAFSSCSSVRRRVGTGRELEHRTRCVAHSARQEVA